MEITPEPPSPSSQGVLPPSPPATPPHGPLLVPASFSVALLPVINEAIPSTFERGNDHQDAQEQEWHSGDSNASTLGSDSWERTSNHDSLQWDSIHSNASTLGASNWDHNSNADSQESPRSTRARPISSSIATTSTTETPQQNKRRSITARCLLKLKTIFSFFHRSTPKPPSQQPIPLQTIRRQQGPGPAIPPRTSSLNPQDLSASTAN
ncbi:hypothetical protein P154DRAFT_333045 [Amniculicola lignicola CBS 123094]|uniref:Uncharacterized protein n=1 Tax=Amniculicola lignicola CBS 123094 TaxID=1392246 RepID=A0A6A5W1Z0_9PLEO|nr:hypothetical protein P154DRAFT_333045 [Amniculicola lignicola CBS 123094]